jgi:hypothetical protein
MFQTDWSDSWRGSFRIELRAEAVGLAWRGWPVLPGTYPAGAQWAGRENAGTDGPVPVHDDWQDRIGTAADEVATWWTGQPYSLLVATGVVLDAIEVDGELGRKAAAVLRTFGMPAPIVATPTGRWMFLTKTGQPLRSELVNHVTLHGAGSYVPLPPSPFEHGVVHWRVKPEVCGWRLPESAVVQDALADAIAAPVQFAELVAAD